MENSTPQRRYRAIGPDGHHIFKCVALVMMLLFVLTATDSYARSGRTSRIPPRHGIQVPESKPPEVDLNAPAPQEPVEMPMPGEDELDASPDVPALSREAAPPAPVRTQSPAAMPVRQQPSVASQPPAGGTAVLNFSDANLMDILRTVSEITGENFILSPGVNAKITVKTVKPIPRSEVFGIFESILELNGLAAVKAGEYYKIVASPLAKQRGIEISTETDAGKIPSGDRLITLLIPIDYIPALELSQIIKPNISAGGSIAINQRTNTLLVTDIASNQKKTLELISALDVNSFQKLKISLVQVSKVDVMTLYDELSEVMVALGYGRESTQLVVVPLERLNSLILFASTNDLINSAKEWIDRLDQIPSADGSSIHIYYVKNDTASNLMGLLEQLFGERKASAGAKAGARTPAAGAVKAAGAPGLPPIGGAAGAGISGGSEDINIYVYEPSNALIIRASQSDYQNMLSTIKELDRPPKQVLIDALIVEVKLDESTKYGIQWSALTGNVNLQQNTGIVSSTLTNPRSVISTPAGVASPTGLAAFATDASKFFGVIQALATDGKVNVLSNPHIIVKNYDKASINIGSDEPVATQSTQTAVTGTAGIIQNIEYRKTGVILTVTPQITEAGMVAMSIRQEVSNVSTDRTVGGAVYPSFSKREAETSVVAKDSETLVIGGLIEENKNVTRTGVPLLSKIPLLGALFRFTSIVKDRTELVILLTPKVVADNDEASAVTDQVKKRLSTLEDLLERSKPLN